MSGIAINAEACSDEKNRACVAVCPVQCIYEFDPANTVLFSKIETDSGVIENRNTPNPEAVAVFSDSILSVNDDECTSCTAFQQPDVRSMPKSTSPTDANTGHEHTFFIQDSRDVFAD